MSLFTLHFSCVRVYLSSCIRFLCKYYMKAKDLLSLSVMVGKHFVCVCLYLYFTWEGMALQYTAHAITHSNAFVYSDALQGHESTYRWYPAEVSSVYEDVWGICQKLWPCYGLGQHHGPEVNPFQKCGSEYPGLSFTSYIYI